MNACCPTCGRPQYEAWNMPGPGGQQWAGPAWGGPMMQGPMPQGGWTCGPGWSPGPGMNYGYGPGHAAGYAPPYYGGLPTDAEIEEMIYDAVDSDPLIPFDSDIDVSVEAGTVYLRGDVPSKRIKHAAGDDAWWIPGVVDVHNDMKVTPRRKEKTEQTAQGEQSD